MSSGDSEYERFLDDKAQGPVLSGFEPVWVPDFLFDFQAFLVDWAVRKGRAAVFADCGLGKTPIQLVWAENVVRKTNRPVLVLTPLGVSAQTVREAAKFGIDAVRFRGGRPPTWARILVTNYEQLHHLDPDPFAGVVCDESSVIKHFTGKRAAAVVDFMKKVPYRLLCTATAAPNDYDELGTSAEALGELGYQDMITRFFKKQTTRDHLGWGRTKYKLREYAERDFWRWVCSWARAVRKPSDLGFPDDAFTIPPFTIREHTVAANRKRPGYLLDLPAVTLEDQREERRRSLPERCEKVAELVNPAGEPAVVWCHLNDEGDALERLIPGSVQVSGSDPDQAKEEAFEAFALGKIRVLVTKPIIAGFGLNWQHCALETFFPSHSFEQYYQAFRRCYRFGQTRPVRVEIVSSEGEAGVVANLNRKSEAADRMFDRLINHVNDSLRVCRTDPFTQQSEIPPWLNPNGISHAPAADGGIPNARPAGAPVVGKR